VKGDKEDPFILIEEVIYQEEITAVILYVPNVGASNFIRHSLLDLETPIDPNSNSGRLQYSSTTNKQVIQTKNQ
jgi:hypothetical protein